MTKAEKMVWAAAFAAVCAESARGYAGDEIIVTRVQKRASEVATVSVLAFRGISPDIPIADLAPAYLRDMNDEDDE